MKSAKIIVLLLALCFATFVSFRVLQEKDQTQSDQQALEVLVSQIIDRQLIKHNGQANSDYIISFFDYSCSSCAAQIDDFLENSSLANKDRADLQIVWAATNIPADTLVVLQSKVLEKGIVLQQFEEVEFYEKFSTVFPPLTIIKTGTSENLFIHEGYMSADLAISTIRDNK